MAERVPAAWLADQLNTAADIRDWVLSYIDHITERLRAGEGVSDD